jgi:hypothetical protein
LQRRATKKRRRGGGAAAEGEEEELGFAEGIYGVEACCAGG